MLDITTIKEHYKHLTDAQVIDVAVKDGHALAPQAFLVLKEEFGRRKLDTSLLETAEQKKQELHEQEIEKIKESTDAEYAEKLWQYVFEEKEKYTGDQEIINGLIERGLVEEQANEMLVAMPERLKERIDSSDTQVTVGAISVIAGILVTLGTFSMATATGGIYVIAWGAVVYGSVRFFKSLSAKKRYTLLLNQVSMDAGTADR